MGVVYLAATPGGAKVALKVLHAQLLHEPGFLTRFGREVEAMRRVNVAGTARVLDADLAAHPPYLVTEFLDGESLDERVARLGPLPATAVTELLAGLAETLVALSVHGLVHRDFKPSNVLLTASGPKLLDFGIAAALDETSLTGTGLIVGSAGWLAPEQIQGLTETSATDVFTLGCLTAFAATTRPPFGRGRPEIYAARLMSQPPDLDGVPADLVKLLAGMLSKDPLHRPSAAEVLARASGRAALPKDTSVLLSAVAVTEVYGTQVLVPPPAPAGPGRSRRVLVLATVAAGLVLGGVAAAVAFGGGAAPRGSAAPGPIGSAPSETTAPPSSPSPSTDAASPALAVFTPSPTNPFTSEVWGDGAVAFTRPAATSYQGATLTRRSLGGVALLAPTGWAMADNSIASDHNDLLLYDAANPAARIEVSASGCVGCIQDQPGNINPLGPLPAGSVSSFVFNDGLSAGFQEGSADGYSVNGVLSLLGTKKDPQGYVIVRLALPPGDTELARKVLNSIRQS